MLNFVFSTDQHCMGVNPSTRKDNFPETILTKMREVNEIAKEYEANAQLFGGDLYDRADTAPSVARNVNKVLSESPCPIYKVLGNHTIFSYNPESMERSMIGVSESAGLFKILNMDEPVFFDDGKTRVAITGCSSYSKLDKDGRIEDYCPKRPDNVDVHIHIVHGFLSLRKRMETIPHTLIDDIVDHTDADIILAGHEHTGFGVIKRYNSQGKLKIFCNPGALGSTKASLEEMDRTIQCAIVRVVDGKYDIKLIPLKCQKPREEVLDRTRIEEEKEKANRIQQFSSSLSSFTVDNLDLYNVAERIGKEEKVSSSIMKETIARLSKAEEDLAAEDTNFND